MVYVSWRPLTYEATIVVEFMLSRLVARTNVRHFESGPLPSSGSRKRSLALGPSNLSKAVCNALLLAVMYFRTPPGEHCSSQESLRRCRR